jgi:hypothetical protein
MDLSQARGPELTLHLLMHLPRYPTARQILFKEDMVVQCPSSIRLNNKLIMSTIAHSIAPLLKPLQLGPFNLRNRIVMSPLTRSRAVPANIPTDLMREYYVQRAKGGAGLIISEGTLISQQGCVALTHSSAWLQF